MIRTAGEINELWQRQCPALSRTEFGRFPKMPIPREK